MNPCKIWIEQCKAARGIEAEFGTVNALKYLVGEKFLAYLQAAEDDAEFRAELPAFVAEIKTIFEPGNWRSILRKKDGRSRSMPASTRRMAKTRRSSRTNVKTNLRRAANELLLIERAKEWLVEGSDT